MYLQEQQKKVDKIISWVRSAFLQKPELYYKIKTNYYTRLRVGLLKGRVILYLLSSLYRNVLTTQALRTYLLKCK